MRLKCLWFLIMIGLFASTCGYTQESPQGGGDSAIDPSHVKEVPKNTIITKGAWYSASDSTTPVPESGTVANHAFSDGYFGMNYSLPDHWTQKYAGPPPSDTGYYVLAQMVPEDEYQEKISAHFEITAQDMFFTPLPAQNARELVDVSQNHLQAGLEAEKKPVETTLAGRPAVFFSYWSPVAGLHWYTVSTEIRCHTVKITMTSRDNRTLEALMKDLNKMKLPAEASPTGGTGGGLFPVCIKDYGRGDHLIQHEEPIFPMRRFNAVPVRIIIGKDGVIKHVHILTAFPEQADAVYAALKKWKYRPYEQNGQPVEVETGIMFGRPLAPVPSSGRVKTASK